MAQRFHFLARLIPFLVWPAVAGAQTVSLATGGSDQIWSGTSVNSSAGFLLDQGPVGPSDSRRDLLIGAPGSASVNGAVYILYGGPTRTGRSLLSSAHVIITSTEAGDRFGTATAGGNIANVEGTVPRGLLVGAPAAQAGRGAVYLFNGGWPEGTRITTANARLKVIGRPGDALGTAVMTVDLDRDGYREIIAGAPGSPGSSRVYIIRGGPALSGTINLDTPGAAMEIQGGMLANIGRVLAAGDINDDGGADLLLGAPDQNSVFVYAGGFAVTGVRGIGDGLAAQYVGEPGDRLGTSIRVANVDTTISPGNKRYNEVLLGAPGNGNGRIYVLWGTGAIGSRNMAAANAMFWGPPGYRIGDTFTTGDVNRDLPDDVVAIAKPLDGSTNSQLLLYYGRSRASYGHPHDARQLVNFSGDASLTIQGDAGAGVVASVCIFEVTGEGARDIIAGVPTEASNTGAVYFTLSPKLSIGFENISLTLPEGTASTSAPVEVINPSIVAIGWRVVLTAPWLSTSVSSGTTVSGSPARFTIRTDPTGLAPGTYTAAANVQSTSVHLEMTLPIPVTLRVLARPRISASVAGPVQPGQSVTWTAAADGSAGALEYRFRRYTAATGWTTVQNYGSSNTFTWTPGASDTGHHVIELTVRPAGATGGYEATTYTGYFAVGDAAPLVALSHQADFDGDGRADPSVFRPGNGFWYALLSGSPGASLARNWGIGIDLPVPGDYDGDRRTDYAVFRPSNGTWYVLLSSTSYATAIARAWGMATDRPVPADYDGDGRTDFAVFRPATGTWFILDSSTGSSRSVAWGTRNDRLVPADYDGDGRADPAIFRPSTRTWYVLESSTRYATSTAKVWGVSTDVPVAGDYDGDRRADFAVFRPSNGTWFVLLSSTGFATSLARAWGAAADVPVPADYNGDRIIDMAVFRPGAPATWFVWNQFARGWGTTGDFPLLVK